jgi:hypothetical protein
VVNEAEEVDVAEEIAVVVQLEVLTTRAKVHFDAVRKSEVTVTPSSSESTVSTC